jgi:hypothetical protein
VVNSALGNGGVDDNAFSGLFNCLDEHFVRGKLLSNQRRNIGLETASTDTHDDETEDESTH